MISWLNTNIVRELSWLAVIIVMSLIIEYAIMLYIDINPVLSVKLQGFVGLLLVGYGLRAAYRIWSKFQDRADKRKNGWPGLPFDSDEF